MAKVYLICGKLCSGKSTYTAKLRVEKRAAVLSVDELMLAVFPPQLGDKHDEYTEKAKRYLLARAEELVSLGVDVILEWGFWRKTDRSAIREWFGKRGTATELHYLDIDDETWRERVSKRNAEVAAGRSDAYFVDDGLMAKFGAMFEPPSRDEVDVATKG